MKYGIVTQLKKGVEINFFETKKERMDFLIKMQSNHKSLKYVCFEDDEMYAKFAQSAEDFKAINKNVSRYKKIKVQNETSYLGNTISTTVEFISDLCDRINNVFYQVSQASDPTIQYGMLLGFINAMMNRLNRVCGRKNQEVI